MPKKITAEIYWTMKNKPRENVGINLLHNQWKQDKKPNKINKLIYTNTVITNDQEIANAIKDHFSTIGENLAANFPNNNDYMKYLNTPNKHSFFLTPTSKTEIDKIITQLQNKKWCRDNQIQPKHLKQCRDSITNPITNIVNLTFSNGRVPDALKISKVILVLKKNEKTS